MLVHKLDFGAKRGWKSWGDSIQVISKGLWYSVKWRWDWVWETCVAKKQVTACAQVCTHLFKNFLQLVVIHTVNGFSIVNKAEADAFSGILFLFQWSKGCWQFDLWLYGSYGSLPILVSIIHDETLTVNYSWEFGIKLEGWQLSFLLFSDIQAWLSNTLLI